MEGIKCIWIAIDVVLRHRIKLYYEMLLNHVGTCGDVQPAEYTIHTLFD